jgi:arsenite methyltransferase
MQDQFTSEDSKKIRNGIREKYIQVAAAPEGLFTYPTGKAGLDGLEYPPNLLEDLPDKVAASYCGVGNPFSLGQIKEGDAVLDIGCGAGVDAIMARKMVGPNGKVIGIDLVRNMIEQAKANLKETDLKDIVLIEDSVENLDFPDESFDVVISNGVFNLIPDKEGTIFKAFRLLKPGGRFMIADQVMTGEQQKDLKSRIDSWFQ